MIGVLVVFAAGIVLAGPELMSALASNEASNFQEEISNDQKCDQMNLEIRFVDQEQSEYLEISNLGTSTAETVEIEWTNNEGETFEESISSLRPQQREMLNTEDLSSATATASGCENTVRYENQ